MNKSRRSEFEEGKTYAKQWAATAEASDIEAVSLVNCSDGVLTVHMIAEAVHGDPEAIFGDGDGLEVTEEFLGGFIVGVNDFIQETKLARIENECLCSGCLKPLKVSPKTKSSKNGDRRRYCKVCKSFGLQSLNRHIDRIV